MEDHQQEDEAVAVEVEDLQGEVDSAVVVDGTLRCDQLRVVVL